MMISRGCKKMMAFVLAIAVVLSVLFVPSPKVAKADDNPSASVLGATLRLKTHIDDTTGDVVHDDNTGTQTMRVGIQIANANKASACAITLTVKGKSYTVSTEPVETGVIDTQQTKLHSKDTVNNSVVYAVVLKNIPYSELNTPIGIVGKVKDLVGQEHNSDETSRSLGGIVQLIQSNFSNLNIKLKTDGKLYKKVNGTESLLEAADLAGYNTDDPSTEIPDNPAPSLGDDESGTIDFSNVNISGGTNYQSYTSVNNGILTIDDDRTNSKVSEVYIPFPGASVGEKVVVAMEGTCTSDTAFRTWIGSGSSDGSEIINHKSANGEFFEKYEFNATKRCDYITIKSSAWNGPNIKDLNISKLAVYYPNRGATVPRFIERDSSETPTSYSIDLTKVGSYFDKEGAGYSIDDDGTMNISFTGQWNAMNIYLPDTPNNFYSQYKYVTISYASEGGDICYSLYDNRIYKSDIGSYQREGKHSYWGKDIKENTSGGKLTFGIGNATDYSGNCIRGIQFFNSNSMSGDSVIKLKITALIFSNENNVVAPDPIAIPQITDTELAADNLVTNGNFANGKTGWAADFYTASVSAVTLGDTNCGLITGRANVYTGFIQTISRSFNQGDVLEYSFKIRRTKDQTTNNYFRIDFDDGSEHNVIPTYNSDGDNRPYCYADHWTTMSGEWTVTQDTSSLKIHFKEQNWNAVGDDFYLDDVQITLKN